jgi:hypothetical protein
MMPAADDTPYKLAAALYRIHQLEAALWNHIRVYRVDDQHPDPAGETHRIMQEELRHHPKTTTENDQPKANAATLASADAP